MAIKWTRQRNLIALERARTLSLLGGWRPAKSHRITANFLSQHEAHHLSCPRNALSVFSCLRLNTKSRGQTAALTSFSFLVHNGTGICSTPFDLCSLMANSLLSCEAYALDCHNAVPFPFYSFPPYFRFRWVVIVPIVLPMSYVFYWVTCTSTLTSDPFLCLQIFVLRFSSTSTAGRVSMKRR